MSWDLSYSWYSDLFIQLAFKLKQYYIEVKYAARDFYEVLDLD